MKDENAFTPTLCFVEVSSDRCSKHAWSDSKWQEKRSKCEWSNCFLWIPFILISGSPNEWWLHTCDACIMITWRLKLQATLVARNKVVKSDFLKNSNFGLTRYLIDLADFWHVVVEWCAKYWMHILRCEFSLVSKIQEWQFWRGLEGPPYW